MDKNRKIKSLTRNVLSFEANSCFCILFYSYWYSFQFRRGWTPGAIGKSVAKLMTFKCARNGPDKDKKKKKKKKKGVAAAAGDSEPDEPLEPKPTLKVQRKGDVFTIQVTSISNQTRIQGGMQGVNCVTRSRFRLGPIRKEKKTKHYLRSSICGLN